MQLALSVEASAYILLGPCARDQAGHLRHGAPGNSRDVVALGVE
jgi:hypothetical protein